MFIILGILGIVYLTMMPQWSIDSDAVLSEFSNKKAFDQVKNIAQKPHYVGSENHDVVTNYLIHELEKMGLETTTQEGFSFSDWGTLTKCKNIIAKIKGAKSDKALLLLSHYDSAPHSSSFGASDAGSGVATILEGVRAFSSQKKRHKNDIIILFTDAKELGLNGASLFVSQHPWAKNVGLVLNFEARGTSGPSYMLMETNGGNAGLAKEFATANTTFPVSNSLMYSIYKMLPNDTDLTVFREQGNIQGFNFAFIDGHYNYHTAQDDSNHLSKKSLAHQGSYLMPLLQYFSNSDLNATLSTSDEVYFSLPTGFFDYPFSWVLPMVILAFGLFLLLVYIGISKRLLLGREMTIGFIPFIVAVLVAGAVVFFGWNLALMMYPQYNDLLNGFTYNGHDYIIAFTLLSLSICFVIYKMFSLPVLTMSHYIAPLLLWIVLNMGIALFLKGAGYFIIPVFAGLLMLAFYVMTQKSRWGINIILSLPAFFLIAPLVSMLPIGFGLNLLAGSAVLTVLLFGLLLPVFGVVTRKGLLSILFFVLSIGFFAKAHYASDYQLGKAKPNSLLYLLNADTNKAYWTTYDTNLDEWTKHYLGQNPVEAFELSTISIASKYKSTFSYMAEAPLKTLEKPTIEFLKDTVVGKNRFLKIRITPNRQVNRYDVFANENVEIHNFKANGLTLWGQKTSKYERKGNKLLSYYVVDQLPLEIEFNVATSGVLDLSLLESSFDLLSNPLFSVAKRADWMIPTPFVLNDAVVIKQKIEATPKPVTPAVVKKKVWKPIVKDTTANDNIAQ